MSTEDQFIQAGHGAGSRTGTRQLAPLAISGNSTVKGSVVIPRGSWFRGITLDTPAAVSGTPTTCNVSVGLTDGGSEVVAAVDAKAQGHIAATIVAALDKVAAFAAADTTLFIQVVTSGDTSSAGAVNAFVDYDCAPR